MQAANHHWKIVAFVCLLIFAGLSTVSCEKESEKNDRLTLLATQFLDESGTPGFAASVAIDGKIVWSDGFGYADLEQLVPIDPALTRFRVGSTAKSMTAMALAQLVEAGKLDIDKPIQAFLPRFPEKAGPITIRMLAGHLAGIRHYDGDEFLSAARYESVADALLIFADDPVISYPGEEFNYSTYGYNLISAIIERTAGQEFLSYMTQNIFEPIGMTETVADRVFPIISNRSRYYARSDDEVVNAPWVDNSNKWAGGGFLSTSEDMVRFGVAHLSGEHLANATIEMMWTSQRTSAGEETGYGIGWGIQVDDSGRRVISHTGGSIGGRTDLRIYPDHDLVIATIANIYPADTREITDTIVDHFLVN